MLFDKASAALPERTRIGFVGRNGTGKTTLFKMVANELQPDLGDIDAHSEPARAARPRGDAYPCVCQSSPVRNCARPCPNDQSSSEFVTNETTTSEGAIPHRFSSRSHSSR